MKETLKKAALAVVKSPAVRREFVILLRLTATVLAARFGLAIKF